MSFVFVYRSICSNLHGIRASVDKTPLLLRSPTGSLCLFFFNVESSCELDNKAQVVRALKGILKNNEERAETIVEEGSVSVLIQQLEITSQISSRS